MKINCLTSGCCIGKVLTQRADGSAIRFPSQIFEMICVLIIAVLLIFIIKKRMFTHKVYAVFGLLYGSTRFVLNMFRETTDYWLGLGIGNLWSVVTVVISALWLLVPWDSLMKHSK